MENTLYRDESRKVIGGVCAGLSDYFEVDVVLIRLAFAFAITIGVGGPAYIILWIVVPRKRDDIFNPTTGYTKPPVFDPPVPVKKRPGNGAIIVGMVLILIGAGLLLNQFDIIPDLDVVRLWPVIFIAVGLAIIFMPGKNRTLSGDAAPWDKQEPTDNTTNDNPATTI